MAMRTGSTIGAMRSSGGLLIAAVLVLAGVVTLVWRLSDREARDSALPQVEREGEHAHATSPALPDEPHRAEIPPRATDAPDGPVRVAGSTHLRASVVDEATGEPLPRYILRFENPKLSADVVSDDQGAIAVDLPAGIDSALIACIDDPLIHYPPRANNEPVLIRAAVPPPTESAVLRVPAGPTYRLRLEPSDVELPTQFVASAHVDQGSGYASLSEVPVRDGSPPWVRFAVPPDGSEKLSLLEVRSRDGLWSGHATGSVVQGIAPGVLVVPLTALASLGIRVADPSGAAIEGVGLFLGTDRQHPFDGLLQTTDPEGQGSYLGKKPGTYVLAARSLRFEPSVTDVEMVAGKFAQVTLTLQPRPTGGSVEGEIVSDSGTYAPLVHVRLAPVGMSYGELRVSPSWTDVGGAKHGIFRFDDVPAGQYKLILWKDDPFDWSPLTIDVAPPRAGIVFKAHDVPCVALAFRMREAGTNVEVPQASVLVHLLERNDGGRGVDAKNGVVAFRMIPADAAFEWHLEVKGFQAVFGTQEDFGQAERRDDQNVRTAEVELRRGWAERFRVVRRGDRAPLIGAEFLVDGRSVAMSDGGGFATIRLSAAPEIIAVQLDGWSVTEDSKLMLVPGRHGTGLFERIEMQPLKK